MIVIPASSTDISRKLIKKKASRKPPAAVPIEVKNSPAEEALKVEIRINDNGSIGSLDLLSTTINNASDNNDPANNDKV
ncbi:hypothetical protein D3C84_716280 [compost metagenome]